MGEGKSSIDPNMDTKELYKRDYKAQDFKIRRDLIGADTFENRKCTDIFCCLVFAVFVAGMAFCTGYGYQYGSPNKLLSPIGGDGKICGVSKGFEGYDYLFIADINVALRNPVNFFDYGVCVKRCPQTKDEKIDCKTTKNVKSCNIDKSDMMATEYFFEYCMPIYESLDPAV